uniref:NACHT domain-containing protein n=1 Tax=Astyanax mexicanus TaxID=7994 RepID=A0A3B1K245_ASTMX
MWEKYQRIHEGITNFGTSVLLNEIYTELYITEGESGEVNNEHEVRQIEAASRRKATQETPIKCNDLFKDQSIRTVLTKGVAGIGKTVSVKKFILDWTEEKANRDVLFIFPLPFRELNLMKTEKISLEDLLYQFFKDTKDLKPRDYHRYKVMFIFDGLDECRLPLDFQNNKRVSDVTQSASVDVLLTNLIRGNLLPSALLWITTRPAAANQIPPDCIDQVTEVRGFSDPQKEEYFRKRIRDQSLAERIITHMKSSRSLYIMCHIPVFCWISATVLERMLGEAEGGEIPKTLTQMFTHFLIFQIKHRSQKYQRKSDVDLDQTREIILALGKLAFQQLEKGNLIFYEEDLRKCSIDVREVSVYSGVCTQIFRQEFGLHLGKVFSFVHLSVQEFLAALYEFLSFISNNRNVLQQKHKGLFGFSKKGTMSDFLKRAVNKALQSENGHLDLFLRFLLGLSLESNQTLLRGLLIQTENRSHSKEEVVEYIKQKIRENPSPEKTISLFHCLNELNDHSLVQEVQKYLNRGGSSDLSRVTLSPDQWSAVAFVMLNSEEELDEFNMWKFETSEECLLRLMPVIKVSKRADAVQDGSECVIYYSRRLDKAERNYCVTCRELLAVVESLKHFRAYVYGVPFLLRTDHASLQWLMRFREPEGQLARWLSRLQEFRFEVVHRPGRGHSNADALSRRPCVAADCKHCARAEEKSAETARCAAISGDVTGAVGVAQVSVEQLRDAQRADRELSWAVHALSANVTPSWGEVVPLGPIAKALRSNWASFSLSDGVLCHTWEDPANGRRILQVVVTAGA